MKRKAALVAAASAALGAVLALGPMPALVPAAGAATAQQQKAGVDSSIQQVSHQLDQVDSQEVVLQLEIDHTQAQRASLATQMKGYDTRLRSVEATLAGAQAALDRASDTLVTTELHLTEVRRQVGLARIQLKQDAVIAYMEQPGPMAASAVLTMRSVEEVQTQLTYLRAATAATGSDLDRFQQLDRQTRDLEAAQQTAQRQALAQRDVIESQQVSLARARQALADASAAQAQTQASLRSLQAQLAGEKTKLQSRLAALQAQSDQITQLLREEEAQQTGTGFSGGQLGMPVPGAPVTSPYGPRIDPILHVESFHTGIDFGAPYGTPIHAAADGVVVAAGPEGGYGNATIVDHGGGIATLYGHQQQILVSAGDHVTRGQVIGLVGCTGWCTGPHVHFEVRVNGAPVDPAPYLGIG